MTVPTLPRCRCSVALAGALIGALALACGGGGSSGGEDLVRAGRAALAKGDNTRAVAMLKKAVKRRPKDRRARLGLALALERTGALREAERVLRDGLMLRQHARLYAALGRVLRLRGKYDQAVKALDRARRLDPKDPGPALQLGEIYERYRKWEIARSHYRAVLAAADLPAHRILAHRRLARLARRENKHTEAIAQLQQALRLAPGRGPLLGELGEALRLAGRPAEAEAPLKSWVKLEPQRGAAQLGLGLVLRDLGKHDQAVRALRLAARLEPKKIAPLLPLAQSLAVLDRSEEAYAVGIKALALAPEDPAVMWLMAPLYHKRRLHTAAVELVGKLEPTRSHDARYWELAGAVRSALGRHDRARQDYARALTLRPRDTRLRRRLAFSARRAGHYKIAVRHLQAVLKLDPLDYDASVHLAIADANLGRRAAAALRLTRLAARQPKRPGAHLYLGWLALRQGAVARAVSLAQRADRLSGGTSAHALDVLAQALLRRGDVAGARKAVTRALRLTLSPTDRVYFQKMVAPPKKKTPGMRPASPRPE